MVFLYSSFLDDVALSVVPIGNGYFLADLFTTIDWKAMQARVVIATRKGISTMKSVTFHIVVQY